MTKINSNVAREDVKINCHDPRYYQEFLLLSKSVNSWKAHINDRSWWLSQEKLSLEIFQRYGYDLQSGVWYCLISCQRHGWTGIANSTSLLAEAFSRKQRQCWPPLAATDLRQKILEWYSTHVATSVYGLQLNSAGVNIITLLEGAISILCEHARSIKSPCYVSLQNLANYLISSRQSLQKNTQAIRLLNSARISSNVEPIPLPSSTMNLQPASLNWKTWLTGGVAGVIFALCTVGAIYWLTLPSTAIRLNALWPGNPLSIRWQNRVSENKAILPKVSSWEVINNQLEILEQRLLDAEQKRTPYLTISELKTAIYQMRQTIQQGGEPVLVQLSQLQNKLDNTQPISDAELDAVAHHLEALHIQLLNLSSQR